jgi:N-glycosylase/DNA lyase
MERGQIPVESLPGGVDLQATLESGQSYMWGREDGRLYEADAPAGGDAWYHAVVDGEALRVRQADGRLTWESTTDAASLLREVLRLEDDLPAVRATAPPDDLVDAAYEAFRGLRLVDDPFFPTVVAFICSAQMRVGRIAEMQAALRRALGEPVSLGEQTYHGFPAPATLAETSEARLRDLGLGYRAPYVRETAAMVARGDVTADSLAGRDYEAARERLTDLVGVGQKVADCICLFSLGHLEAVPLDTWIRSAIEEHYPDCARDGYAETSRAIRERLGGAYAGYHQTYLFHYLRTGAAERATAGG